MNEILISTYLLYYLDYKYIAILISIGLIIIYESYMRDKNA